MFNDFDQDAEKEEGRGRRAASLMISGLVFLLLGSALAATMATVRAMQPHRPDREVTFEELPVAAPEPEEAPPPPPPPPPVRRAPNEPVGQRPVLDGPPSGIPDERPEEAEGELAAVNHVGPIENGAVMGEGDGPVVPPRPETPRVVELPRTVERAPEQERETIRRARFLADQSGCRSLIIPDQVGAALGARTVTIRVRALVGTDGRVMNASVVEGDAAVPNALVIDCATEWVFAPATLPDGTAVPYPAIRTFVITPRT